VEVVKSYSSVSCFVLKRVDSTDLGVFSPFCNSLTFGREMGSVLKPAFQLAIEMRLHESTYLEVKGMKEQK
jgi:hypothetical protein